MRRVMFRTSVVVAIVTCGLSTEAAGQPPVRDAASNVSTHTLRTLPAERALLPDAADRMVQVELTRANVSTPWREASTRDARAGVVSAGTAGWFARHPVLAGAIVGATAGTALAYARWGSEGTFVGVYAGGGVGAVVGWVVSR